VIEYNIGCDSGKDFKGDIWVSVVALGECEGTFFFSPPDRE